MSEESDDDRLTKALAHANYKTTLVQQRENLKLRYANALLHAKNGGIFTVNPTLLAMVDLLIRCNHTEAVLIDDKAIPILIDDLPAFLDETQSVYAEASNDYLVEWEKLRKARNVNRAVNA